MKNLAIATAIVALGIVANSAPAKAQGASGATMVDPNRVILVLNGEEIKGAEYYRRMEYLPNVGTRIGSGFAEFPPGLLTLQQIIDERLAFALAKDKGVYPTEEEVDAEIKLRQADRPKLLDEWIAGGGNIDELKYLIRYQLSQFKIQTFGITITDPEVEQFYKDHPDSFKTERQVKLRLIAVASSEETQAVDKELATGKQFADVAKELSVDISKTIGGEYGTIVEDKLNKETKDAIDAIKIGETTKWLTNAQSGDKGAYIKFLLEDIIPEKKVDLDAHLRRQIRRSMMLDRGRVKNPNISREMDALRAKAKIDIKQQEFADAYKKFMDAYMAQRGTN